MAEFLAPLGLIWVLRDSEELGVTAFEDGGLALLIFTDEDLATTFAEKTASSKTAQAVPLGRHFLDLLLNVKALGVTHIAVDATLGRMADVTTIDKAINDVSTSLR